MTIYDATKSVIYGTEPPAALDSDKFSEISLDQPVDAEVISTQPQEYNPLQNLDTFLPVATDEQQQQQQRDENIFSQATAIKDSLSQLPVVLPGVASSVFSSFSSILKGGRTSPYPPGKDSSSHTSADPSNYTEQLAENHETSTTNQYQCFYDQSIQQQQQQQQLQQPETPAVVPTFYSPTDPTIQRPEASLSPSSENQSSNLYRLKERKKLYAPIPGLANNPNLISPNPIPSNSIPPNPSVSPSPGLSQPTAAAAPSQNSSFSLSSFFSGAPLLDKVLPKFPEPAVNVDQGPSQPFFYSPSQQPAPTASQFFNPNQFSASDPHQQNPHSSNEENFVHSTQPPFIVSSVSAPPLQATLNQQPTPPPIATVTSFNLNPFQKPSVQQQQPAPRPPSTPQIFNVNASPLATESTQQVPPTIQPSIAAPPVAQFFQPSPFSAPNLQQPPTIGSSKIHLAQSTPPPFSVGAPPLPTAISSTPQTPVATQPTQTSTAQFFNPNQFAAPSSQQPISSSGSFVQSNQPLGVNTPPLQNQSSVQQPAVTPNLYNLNPYQNPSAPLQPPSASSSPALVQQTAIPNSYLPPSAAPPSSGQSVSYRLKGKPHYRQPNQAVAQSQAANPSVLFFNPVPVQQPIATSNNFQIFNPLGFDNSQQPTQQASIAAIPSAQFPSAPPALIPSQSVPSTQFPPSIPQIPIAQTPPVQFPAVPVPQSESVAPPLPVSVFNPFNQASSTPETSQVNLLEKPVLSQPPLSENVAEDKPIALQQDYQQSAPPLSFIVPQDAFPSLPINTSAISEPRKPLFSKPFTVRQTLSSENVAEVRFEPIKPEAEVESEPEPPKQPVILDFFQSTPFDPFQQTQQNFNLDNITPQALNDSNANTDSINTGVQNLTLDTENNLITESAVQQSTEPIVFKPVETSTFDPISFFNNNSTESVSRDSSNANELQIQSFFNEPPPLSETQENVQEKNFNFIRTNLLNKRIERIANAETASPETLSIASVIAEPASSAPSETSYIDPPTADVTAQSLPESLQNNQDQADGINIYNWLNKQEPPNMATTPVERTSTPATSSSTNIAYRPVYKHWFYKTTSESKRIWIPFSFPDSMLLEEAFVTKDKDIVTTDGGRFDVNIPERTRNAVYWTAESNEVRRCSWFYKGVDFRLIPYEEHVAEQLEEEYREASHTGEWQRKIPLTTGETVIFNGPSDILHFLQSQSTDGWNNAMQNTEVRPRAVKRGTDEFAIDDGEPEQIDHLLFMVHGIGSACDLKFRKVEEVVDEFRSIALQLVQSHYRSSCDQGIVGRVEVLPISWHSELHSEESGIDEKLKAITLESIPKLRNFTNDTLLDILFYTSPVFCQQIIDAVSGNINKCYAKFCERNPDFHGSVSVSGHSLGSVILFDLLQHQRVEVENSENLENATRVKSPLKRHCSQQINYTIGNAGTGQPYISYPQLSFQPKHFFALGSPIGMFVTIRGIDALGLEFKLPTTEHFFNIFHPYDPVAYRIEALVNTELQSMRPVLVPHHKGRKRMHLELRETVARVGADIKQKILQTLKSTIDTVYSYTTLHKGGPNDTKAITQEVNKVIDEQLTLDDLETSANTSSASSEIDTGETDLALGKFNGGRRIDYVLQEAPLEIINEYLFALTSHVCYWGSEDATLFIMKEIYTSLGVQADTKIPQPTMTIERPSPANSVKSSPTTS
ncbi:uncharacterized protein LOC129578613 isoform X2 [Sitodiplosis mosellana]|uniref:uncharacterized protein LOC129578613 isoform X2 n=1 Tax=Sitodiplosis mosellana TaxID=263140 RepID=UPI002443F66A|nr:uncharacterized protein LOC129578613 isoform X2 [Sitodiplosis mosellana]